MRKHVKPSDLPKGDESRESHLSFVLLNWEMAAAFAWKGYLENGRGVVAINVLQSKEAPPGMPYYFGKSTGYYISTQGMKQVGKGWDWEDAERIITQYNPEAEVVFVFLRIDEGSSVYRVRVPPGRITPPESYVIHRAELGSPGPERNN